MRVMEASFLPQVVGDLSGCCCCNTTLSVVVLVGQSLNRTDGDLQEACRLGFQNYLIIVTWLVSCSDTQERKTARALFVDLCSIRNMEGKKYFLEGEVKLNEEIHVVLKEVFRKC